MLKGLHAWLRAMYTKERDAMVRVAQGMTREFWIRISVLTPTICFIVYVTDETRFLLWYAVFALTSFLLSKAAQRLVETPKFRQYLRYHAVNLIDTAVFCGMTMLVWSSSMVYARYYAFALLVGSLFLSLTARLRIWSLSRSELVFHQVIITYFWVQTLVVLQGGTPDFGLAAALIALQVLLLIIMREIVQVNQEIEDARERNLQAQKLEAIGQLTGGIAHDFNNILTVVRGNLDLAREVIDPDERNGCIDEAQVAVSRAAALTERLLAFARKAPLEATEIDMPHFLTASMTMLARVVPTFRTDASDVPTDLWPSSADRNQLYNAILNLVINARDALNGRGDVWLEARNYVAQGETELLPFGQHFVHLTVADNGPGMPPEVSARAFEPFFTTKDVGQGSGLGLSMVKGFLEQTGGTVIIESAVNEGTKVHLFLPALVEEKSATEEEALAAE